MRLTVKMEVKNKEMELVLEHTVRHYYQLQTFWSLLAFCVTEMIYVGPWPHTTLCVQLRQVNTNIENCYIFVAFLVASYCTPAP